MTCPDGPQPAFHTTARRTTLRPGAHEAYERVHAAVPPRVLQSLVGAGVLRWQIWRDGTSLFHLVDTVDGYDAMVAAIEKLPPVDPEWDSQIATLLDSEPTSDVRLRLVWSLDAAGQHAGDAGHHVTPAPALPRGDAS